jgi:ketosteroid isomerase-like protein
MVELAAAIERYFEAQNAHDPDTVAACFAEDGTVYDEKRTHVGREAIRAWQAGPVAAYEVTVEPLEVHQEAGTTEVSAKVAGKFPGSPIVLSHRFDLAGTDLIRRLEIG